MKKIILGILLVISQMVVGIFAYGEFSSYSFSPTNLPLTFPTAGEFPLTLNLKTTTLGDEGYDKVKIIATACPDQVEIFYNGQDILPLGYVPVFGKSEFSLLPQVNMNLSFMVVVNQSNDCVLNFSLVESNGNKRIASTKVGVLGKDKCPASQTNSSSIDEGLNYETLPDGSPYPSTDSSAENTNSSTSNTPSKTTAPSDEKLPLTEEMKKLFDFAKEKGLLLPEETEAFLVNPVTRLRVANMLVHIAISQGQQADFSKMCSFADMQNAPKSDQLIAKLACQLNIMGINPDTTPLDNFYPKNEITRDEMLTAISRLVWGKKFNEGGDTFYQKHFENMKSLGLAETDNPASIETGGGLLAVLEKIHTQKHLLIEKKVETIVFDPETDQPVAVKETSKRKFW